VAGGDTTALSLTFALYYMVKDRRVYERSCREIRERFGSKEEITGQTAATLPYLEAAILEGNYRPDSIGFLLNIALRIRPVAGGLPSPRITPPEGTMIAGRFITGNVSYSSNFADPHLTSQDNCQCTFMVTSP
jgi:hypothetical protein